MNEEELILAENCPACSAKLMPEDIVCPKCGSDV